MRTNLNKFQRCPGCGNFMIHLAIKQALQELNIPKNETVVIT
jgi:pyruvate/2-oxoacid:ferredoxin oxidoreductase beta subunit